MDYAKNSSVFLNKRSIIYVPAPSIQLMLPMLPSGVVKVTVLHLGFLHEGLYLSRVCEHVVVDSTTTTSQHHYNGR